MEDAMAEHERIGARPVTTTPDSGAGAAGPQNVAVVQQLLEHFMATGEPDWGTLHEQVEVYDHDTPDQRGEYHGHAGVARWLEEWGAAWSDYSIELEELIDVDERVVAVFNMNATGLGSGVKLERQDGMTCELRDGKIARLDYYNSREQALQAAGRH
jgi:ketosteroid isomerase-like protein